MSWRCRWLPPRASIELLSQLQGVQQALLCYVWIERGRSPLSLSWQQLKSPHTVARRTVSRPVRRKDVFVEQCSNVIFGMHMRDHAYAYSAVCAVSLELISRQRNANPDLLAIPSIAGVAMGGTCHRMPEHDACGLPTCMWGASSSLQSALLRALSVWDLPFASLHLKESNSSTVTQI